MSTNDADGVEPTTLCGQPRAYLPPDIFRGRLSFRLNRKPVKSETLAW
jgi:hypothetical protein